MLSGALAPVCACLASTSRPLGPWPLAAHPCPEMVAPLVPGGGLGVDRGKVAECVPWASVPVRPQVPVATRVSMSKGM